MTNEIQMKYVLYPNEQFMLVPRFVAHATFVRGGAVSAGFVFLDTDPDGQPVAYCRGDSESLKLKSRPEDSEILTRGLRRKWGD